MSPLQRAQAARAHSERPDLTPNERAAWRAASAAWEAFANPRRAPGPRAAALQAQHRIALQLAAIPEEPVPTPREAALERFNERTERERQEHSALRPRVAQPAIDW